MKDGGSLGMIRKWDCSFDGLPVGQFDIRAILEPHLGGSLVVSGYTYYQV